MREVFYLGLDIGRFHIIKSENLQNRIWGIFEIE